MFNSSSFIAAYNPEDKFIVFIDSNNRRINSINICLNKKIELNNKQIEIYQEGKDKIVLPFTTTLEAKNAFNILNNTIDELKPNCEIQISTSIEPKYKVYTAFLYFEYNYPPSGTIFDNTIGNIVWQYYADINGDGSNIKGWKAQLLGAFPENKVWSTIYCVDIDGNGGSSQADIILFRNTDDELFLIPGNIFGVYYNIEIRIYI